MTRQCVSVELTTVDVEKKTFASLYVKFNWVGCGGTGYEKVGFFVGLDRHCRKMVAKYIWEKSNASHTLKKLPFYWKFVYLRVLFPNTKQKI